VLRHVVIDNLWLKFFEDLCQLDLICDIRMVKLGLWVQIDLFFLSLRNWKDGISLPDIFAFTLLLYQLRTAISSLMKPFKLV
jgi:hypothetical protein